MGRKAPLISLPTHWLLILFLARACGILVPQPGIKPVTPAWEHEVQTPGLPGKSPVPLFAELANNGYLNHFKKEL